MSEGLRFNEGKTRYDLVPVFAQEQYARVLTFGVTKYAERNWEKGMPWSKVSASLKRHIAAFERGEDYDKETGLLHMAHAMCNAAFLLEYYKIYPMGDDRPKLKKWRIGLDIDEVLCDFVGGMMQRFPDIKERSVYWNDPVLDSHFPEVKDDKSFWLGLESRIDPKSLPFEPVCYVTSRPIPVEISEQWLKDKGFPTAKVISLNHETSKVDSIKSMNVDIFIDDRYDTFVELNEAGILCYLMSAPHNMRYDVGFKRINSLSDIFLK